MKHCLNKDFNKIGKISKIARAVTRRNLRNEDEIRTNPFAASVVLCASSVNLCVISDLFHRETTEKTQSYTEVATLFTPYSNNRTTLVKGNTHHLLTLLPYSDNKVIRSIYHGGCTVTKVVSFEDKVKIRFSTNILSLKGRAAYVNPRYCLEPGFLQDLKDCQDYQQPENLVNLINLNKIMVQTTCGNPLKSVKSVFQ